MQELFFLPRDSQDTEGTEGTEDIMKLRDDDKDWIAGEISRQISESLDQFKPKGWLKVTRWLREWGVVATAISVPLVLLGLLITVAIFASSGMTKNAAFQTRTEDRLTLIEGSLKNIDANFKTIALKRFSDGPVNSQSIAEAKGIIDQAISRRIPIDKQVVEKSGLKLVDASAKAPDAWPVALRFLTYKSTLNFSTLQVLPKPQNNLVTKYAAVIPEGQTAPEFKVAGQVPIQQAAQLITQGKNLNSGNALGNQYIFATGGGITLDDTQLRNVVFIGVHIVYGGGVLTMNNVYFVNCVFDIKPQPDGQEFAKALLAQPSSVSFKAS
jgi:hypothetical protein